MWLLITFYESDIFFHIPSGNNDVNVFDEFPLIANMLLRKGSSLTFMVNGKKYPHYYLLAYGIYPRWVCFVQTTHESKYEKMSFYAKIQEFVNNDFERSCYFRHLVLQLSNIHVTSGIWS
jgi:hypothetical protein